MLTRRQVTRSLPEKTNDIHHVKENNDRLKLMGRGVEPTVDL
jgi:hypothetical protein